MRSARRYLLISPCRDEAQYLRRTLDSVAAQSVPPALWVVVDDGSTDDTPAILEEYTRQLPYLRVVRRVDRGRRRVGPGVIDAFYAGLETVDLEMPVMPIGSTRSSTERGDRYTCAEAKAST